MSTKKFQSLVESKSSTCFLFVCTLTQWTKTFARQVDQSGAIGFGLVSHWLKNWREIFSQFGSQAGVVDINHAFHLYNKCCMWIEFQSISTWLRGFSPGTPVSSLLKIDSKSNPSGCGAVLRGHIWVVFRDRAPSWHHSSFDLTSLSCALWNSVFDCEKGRLAGQTFTFTFNHKA